MRIRLFAFICIAAFTCQAQFQNVLISTLNSPEEVCIAINPKNTNQIIAGSNIDNAYHSNDGGLTWTHHFLTCDSFGVWGDPVVIWDTLGLGYYLHLSNPTPTLAGGSWIDRIVVQRTADGGQNYSSCNFTGKNGSKAQDKHWAVVNPKNNEMHVTWTQFDVYGSSSSTDSSIILYSRTADKGVTWSTPKRISAFAGDCIDSDKTVEGAVPAIGPNGEIYVSWAGPKGLVFQKSTDNGNTWLPQEKIIGPIAGGWDYNISGLQRCNGLPFTFCDLSSGPHRGNIYINYSDHTKAANDGDIWVVKSADGGNTFSAPVRVNNDVPGKEQFMSAMTIDQVTGYVYVIFYDRRNFASGANTDVYMAVSKDGGNLYYNYKINASTFNPNANIFFGDYISISAHNNVIRPMWTQLTGTTLSVYTAIVNPVILGINDAREEALSILNAVPNPFKAGTTINFEIKKELKLTIELVNSEGKIIETIENDRRFLPGKNAVKTGGGKLAQGVYYLVFYGDEKSQFVKLVHE